MQQWLILYGTVLSILCSRPYSLSVILIIFLLLHYGVLVRAVTQSYKYINFVIVEFWKQEHNLQDSLL